MYAIMPKKPAASRMQHASPHAMLQPGSGGAARRFWDVWRLFQIDSEAGFTKIHFPAMPPQATKLLALFFTVAFGSSMDVVRAGMLRQGLS